MVTWTETELIARSFQTLSDPVCVRLVEFLAAADRSIEECAACLNVTDRSVQHYLSRLRRAGWVTANGHGDVRSYQLADPRAAELMLLARAMATENFGALAECTQLDQRVQ